MSTPLSTALRHLAERRDLSSEQAAGAFGVVMKGEASLEQVVELLTGFRAKGETAEEVEGATRALRAVMLPVHAAAGAPVVDTCGTGGGAVGTFNVSTAAGLVAAGAGARVAKHGNRSYSSRCGSADVLEALGVPITHGPERAAQVLDEVGMVFLFAPNYHPAMRYVGPARKQLGVATIMNLLGPLANPAGVRRQVVGVADRTRAPLLAEALRRLGAEHAMVVHGEVGMDEISPAGLTHVWEVRHGRVGESVIDPAALALGSDDVSGLAGGEPRENAARVERLLDGATDDEPARRAVLLNAAAALYVSGLATSMTEAVDLARRALESGRARQVLEALRRAR